MTAIPDLDAAAEHDWREAGDAWGHAAADWACLFEHYATTVIMAIHQRTGVGDGTELLELGDEAAQRHLPPRRRRGDAGRRPASTGSATTTSSCSHAARRCLRIEHLFV